MNILGVSCGYHDSAACLLRDGKIVAAAQEERFSRRKHDPRLPRHAMAWCLKEAGLERDDIDAVALHDKPLTKLTRLLSTYSEVAPKGLRAFLDAMPAWLQDKGWIPLQIERFLEQSGYRRPERFLMIDHHQSHAASAFHPSPFEEAAVLTIDGVGEWACSGLHVGEGNQCRMLYEQRFPHSLGLLYSAFTYFTGFKVNSGEYKLMGLAPYGEPRHVDLIKEHLITIREDGSFRLDMDYFDYLGGFTMTSERFADLFGGPARTPETDIGPREMDLARSIQAVTEEVMFKMARHAASVTGKRNLCLAGGVALNCVANGVLYRSDLYDGLFIQPAAGDAGGALGAALQAWHHLDDNPRELSSAADGMQGALLGPSYASSEIRSFLDDNGIPHEQLGTEDRPRRIAELLDDEKVIGMFQGRMEFGPRALGNRSIIADARSTRMQSHLNLATKFRESFRPFAPIVLREDAHEYFEEVHDSPYMLLVDQLREERCLGQDEPRDPDRPLTEWVNAPRSDVPAITHVDWSARIQTVDAERYGPLHSVLRAFKERTGYGILVNTSFNVRGEPIVCTPEDAYRCFMRTGIDYLVLEDCLLDKRRQPAWTEDGEWRDEYGLD
ncbi:MAG: carbamoyltransferase [Acidobacteriota bacterium]